MSKSSTRINLYTRIRFSRVVTYLHSLLQHAFSRNSLSTMISHEYIYTLSINNTIIVPKSEFVSLVNLPHIWVITYRSRATTRPLWHMSTRIDIWHDTYVLIPFGLDTRIDHTYSGSFHRVYRLDSKQRISLLNKKSIRTKVISRYLFGTDGNEFETVPDIFSWNSEDNGWKTCGNLSGKVSRSEKDKW